MTDQDKYIQPNESESKKEINSSFEIGDFSTWTRLLAKNYSVEELKKQLKEVEKELPKYSSAHLRDLQTTQRGSQRRAHNGNMVAHLGEKKMAIASAIMLLEFYPLFKEMEKW